jgi:hypothetical protein
MPKRLARPTVNPGATPDAQAALLLWGAPREILARISAGDPLHLAQRCRERLRARALLVDARSLLPRLYALVARKAFDWRGDPVLERFLGAVIDEALEDYLSAAQEAAGPAGSALSPRRLAAFARLPEPIRQAFIAALVERRPLDHLAAQRGQDLSALGRDLRLAIDQLVPALSGPNSARGRDPTEP